MGTLFGMLQDRAPTEFMRSVERDATRVRLLFLDPSRESLRIGAVKQTPQAICSSRRVDVRIRRPSIASDQFNGQVQSKFVRGIFLPSEQRDAMVG
jgi:hypothetical protein